MGAVELALEYTVREWPELFGSRRFRTVSPPGGGTWYAGRDVAAALGYPSLSAMQKRLRGTIDEADARKFTAISGKHSGRRFPDMWFYRRDAVRKMPRFVSVPGPGPWEMIEANIPSVPQPAAIVPAAIVPAPVSTAPQLAVAPPEAAPTAQPHPGIPELPDLQALAAELVRVGGAMQSLADENADLRRRIAAAEARLAAIRQAAASSG